MKTTAGESVDVVIVEDDTNIASLFAMWLEPQYTVHVAHDCETAYDLIDKTIDVVLLDRHLPDGNGDDVLAHIREMDYGCRVAMVSAVEPEFDIIQMGFDDYLCKPTTEDELQGTVERLLVLETFSEAITELYTLSSKRAHLKANYSATELKANEEYERLDSRIADREAELTEIEGRLSDRQYKAAFRQLTSSGTSD